MNLKLPALPPRRRILRVLGEVLVVVALIVGARAYMTRGTVSGPAPAIAAASLSGDRVVLADLRGHAVLVYFWATWCPVCRAQQGTIAAIARDRPVIAVAMQSGTDDAVLRYMKEHDWRVPVVNDLSGELTQSYGVRAVPASFIVDPNGMIRTVEVGYTTEIGLRLRLWWAETIGA